MVHNYLWISFFRSKFIYLILETFYFFKENESFIYLSEALNKMNEVDYTNYIEILKNFSSSIDTLLVLPKIRFENFALLVFEMKKFLSELTPNYSILLDEKLKPILNKVILKLKETKRLESELSGHILDLKVENVNLIQCKIIKIFDVLIFPYYQTQTSKNDIFLDLFVNWLVMLPTDQSKNDFKTVVKLSLFIKQILDDKKNYFSSEKWIDAMLSVIIFRNYLLELFFFFF